MEMNLCNIIIVLVALFFTFYLFKQKDIFNHIFFPICVNIARKNKEEQDT